jgi:hypothetical protein
MMIRTKVLELLVEAQANIIFFRDKHNSKLEHDLPIDLLEEIAALRSRMHTLREILVLFNEE